MTATHEQVKSSLLALRALADAIRDLEQVPSGHLYAAVMSHMSLATYESFISTLIKSDLVRRENSHLLVWIGPPKETGT